MIKKLNFLLFLQACFINARNYPRLRMGCEGIEIDSACMYVHSHN